MCNSMVDLSKFKFNKMILSREKKNFEKKREML